MLPQQIASPTTAQKKRGQDQESVDQFLRGDLARRQLLLDPSEYPQPLTAHEPRTDDTDEDEQGDGVEDADRRADLDDEVDLDDGNDQEEQEQDPEHDLIVRPRGRVSTGDRVIRSLGDLTEANLGAALVDAGLVTAPPTRVEVEQIGAGVGLLGTLARVTLEWPDATDGPSSASFSSCVTPDGRPHGQARRPGSGPR